jgi:hypothetical protein
MFVFHRRAVRATVLLLLIWVGCVWAGPARATANAVDIVAIADVHGDFDDFVAILRRSGLIDTQNDWTGGKTIFVQVGDLLDRGPKPREVMDLMMSLEKKAGLAGGQVVSLLGNHEMMNIMGDLRYVTPLNYASFANSDSEERRKAAYEEYVKWTASHQALLAELPQPMELTEAEWMARHPPGFLEQREAFSSHGTYGAWIRGHAAVAEIGGIIFLHGGIDPDLAKTKLNGINDKIHEEIKAFDASKQYFENEKLILPFYNLQEMSSVLQAEIIAERKSRVFANEQRQTKIMEFLAFQDWLSVRVDGPLWFRGYDLWSEEEGSTLSTKVLEAYKATHFVLGHTVQKGGRIRSRFGDKVFLVDTGMLSSYYPGGRASALEICGGTKFIGVYLDQQVILLDSTGSPPQDAVPERTTVQGEASAPRKSSVVSFTVCSATTTTTQ